MTTNETDTLNGLTSETREKIDNIVELRELVQSAEWSNDTMGRLHRKAYDIMFAHGISEADAQEWLHEED